MIQLLARTKCSVREKDSQHGACSEQHLSEIYARREQFRIVESRLDCECLSCIFAGNFAFIEYFSLKIRLLFIDYIMLYEVSFSYEVSFHIC